MSQHCPWRWPAALAALAAFGVAAQPATPAPSTAAATARSETPTQATGYRSAFEHYQPFAEQPLVPWRQANDTVRAVGGWRAYAKEASEQSEAPSTSPAGPASPHHGHGTP